VPTTLLDTLDRWLDGDSAAGLPLRAPTRWAIVTRLIANEYPSAGVRLRAEMLRDSSSEGKRQAFVAAAAAPDSATKARYFTRWFGDSTLNEEWVTSSLRAFHDDEQDVITRPYLMPSLDTLPWVQKNRRIFFLGAWLSATLGGQSSPAALAQVDAWLRANPRLGADLRRKVLQARDELERTVKIRKTFPTGGPQIRVSSDRFF
jgi:aminopeptidase N